MPMFRVQLGQQMRGVLGAGVQAALIRQLLPQTGQLGGQNPAGQIGAGELAEGLGRWDPAGGSVRLIEVAVIGQLGHDVADRGRTQAVLAAPGDGTRRHGLARLDVNLHQRVQHLEGPRGQCGI